MSLYFGNAPIGAIVGWNKSLGKNSPQLEYGWVECNGQACTDPNSPFSGQTLPALNTSNNQRFLRGSGISGPVGGSETHNHTITFSTASANITGGAQTVLTQLTSPTSTSSNLVPYYSVVWVTKIK